MSKILIIEDDKILLKALNIEMLRNNFEVISAEDGLTGLELIEKEKPELVLLDLVLPKMHGFEVLEKMKANKDIKDIPVLILSNLGQDSDIKKGLELGADDYYVKSSFDLSELSKKILTALK